MSRSKRRKKILDLVSLEKSKGKLERRIARLQGNLEALKRDIVRLEQELIKQGA